MCRPPSLLSVSVSVPISASAVPVSVAVPAGTAATSTAGTASAPTAGAASAPTAGAASTSAAGTTPTAATGTTSATGTSSATAAGNRARCRRAVSNLGHCGAELARDLGADVVQRQYHYRAGNARKQRVLNEVLAVRAPDQRARKLQQSLCERCPGHGGNSAGLFRLVGKGRVCRSREELSIDRATAQVFSAFRSGSRSPVCLLEHNGLAAANREAVLHVSSNEVALNAVAIPVCRGSHSPEEHQVLFFST